jgi:hypothetical protein
MSAATAATTAVVRSMRLVVLSFMSRVLLDRSTMPGRYEDGGRASFARDAQGV